MSDRYRSAADFARPEKEIAGRHEANTTTLLARWDTDFARPEKEMAGRHEANTTTLLARCMGY